MSIFSNLRPSKIDPNWDFWFENKPSGNPAKKHCNKNWAVKMLDKFSVLETTHKKRYDPLTSHFVVR
jgi:hypothetical protein